MRSCRNQIAFLSKSMCVIVETYFRYCRKSFLQKYTDFTLYSKLSPSNLVNLIWPGRDFQMFNPLVKPFGSPETHKKTLLTGFVPFTLSPSVLKVFYNFATNMLHTNQNKFGTRITNGALFETCTVACLYRSQKGSCSTNPLPPYLSPVPSNRHSFIIQLFGTNN